MREFLALLLCLLLCLPALAESAAPAEPAAPAEIASPEPSPVDTPTPEAAEPEGPLAPYDLPLPEGVTLQSAPGSASVTFRHSNGFTRAVAMVSTRVLDEGGDRQNELAALMGLFSPEAQDIAALALAEGFHGVYAVTPYALEGAGERRVSQLTVMVLFEDELQGELLILSAYDMNGDDAAAQAFLLTLLEALTVDGQSVLPPQEAEEGV